MEPDDTLRHAIHEEFQNQTRPYPRSNGSRPTPKRKKTVGDAIGEFIGAVVLFVLLSLLNGAFLMLLVLALHATWFPHLPLLGYWWSVLIVGCARGLWAWGIR